MSKGPFPSREAWMADKEAEIAARLSRLQAATDPRGRKKLENGIARYRQLLTIGPEGASDAAVKAAGSR